jgi:acetyl/propionyl-CoA carboxylase alpha subunit
VSVLDGKRIAIANRGEIAVRIAETCRRLGAVPIVLLGEPDLDGYAARRVGRVEVVGPAGAEFDVERVVAAARRVEADFLHPGYGFLSERAALAEACEDAGVRFVGPSADTLRLCGDKLATRATCRCCRRVHRWAMSLPPGSRRDGPLVTRSSSNPPRRAAGEGCGE